MERKVYFSRLLDFYGGLLPEKQRACMFQYYYDDLSLAEVSENLGITRQGVRDLLKRGEASLEKSEAELRLIEREDAAGRERAAIAARLSLLAQEAPEPLASRLREIVDSINSRDV
ncbi:MAG: DNA-binding protein [Clostridia bacterium]|nr:DNA-binding protein [Clostridia bacterium]